MRVTFLINGLARGGAEGQLVRLALELKSGGWAVSMVVLRREEGYGQTLMDQGIEVTVLKQGVRAFSHLRAVLREQHADVLVTFLFRANILGRLAGRTSGVPVISSIRNQRFGGATRLGQLLADTVERITNPLAARVVVNSAVAAMDLAGRGVVRSATTRVIPNVLVAPILGAGERAAARIAIYSELGLAAGSFVWLAVGRLEPQKNHAALLDAFATLPASRRGILLVAGDGSLRGELEASLVGLGLADGTVRFLGFRSDIAQLMAAADRLVLPSRWEGLPNVVIEAMANGLPVVATRVGGVSELLEDEVTGFLAPSPAAEDLAAAMARSRKVSSDEVQAVVQAALDQASRYLDIGVVVDSWRALILEVADNAGSAR